MDIYFESIKGKDRLKQTKTGNINRLQNDKDITTIKTLTHIVFIIIVV